MRKTLLHCAAALVLSLGAPGHAAACITFQNAFTPTYKANPNLDLNDYGRIHHDADDPNCARAAMYSLTDKLNRHLDGDPAAFQQWLDGFLVAEIYAAAMRIGANGWAGKALDEQLVELSGRFRHNVSEPSGTCGGDHFNTCMDDLTGTASGYAWMAAYMSRRPNRFTREEVDATIALAEDYLRRSLEPVSAAEPKNGICLRDKSSAGYVPLCTGTIEQLRLGTAETFTVNGQQQMLHYGFGLMTSVASAKLALELAGSSFAFTDDEKRIARALMEEVQRHFDPATREFTADCVQRKETNGVLTYPLVDCGAGYHPDMYALRGFYDARLGGIPAGSYDSNAFDLSPFALDDRYEVASDGATRFDPRFFSYGRFETYAIMGYAWWVLPRAWMPRDDYEPRGWLDGISETGLASGWACDPDMPDGRTRIDFYTGDGATYAGTAAADEFTGSAYDRQCLGGTAHRFTFQLPRASKGKPLRAWALDYTWYGVTELGCSQSPTCSW
ncbi:MAG TPA: hypothetical protein VND45_16180 [Thermoanaerobaculia bacterium]|nr:hypothetical protein [Thermoanaerobaculia bacterium]